jgi:hypothetical protein
MVLIEAFICKYPAYRLATTTTTTVVVIIIIILK